MPGRGYIRVAGQNIAIYQRANTVCTVPSFRQRDYLFSNSGYGVIPTDLNGDQLPDLVITGIGYSQLTNRNVATVDILSGDTEGNLTPINQLQIETTNGSGVIAIAGKDFNRDQKNDIVAVDANSGKVTVFWNDGTVKFTQQTFNLDMAPRYAQINLEAADLDQDGYPDLIAGVYNNTTSS